MPVVLKALFFTAALICFAVATVRGNGFRGLSLVPLGLAFVTVNFTVDAWAAID